MGNFIPANPMLANAKMQVGTYPNLVANDSYEIDTASWNAYAGAVIARQTGVAYSGTSGYGKALSFAAGNYVALTYMDIVVSTVSYSMRIKWGGVGENLLSFMGTLIRLRTNGVGYWSNVAVGNNEMAAPGLSDNQWHTLTLTRNDTYVTIYIDGVQVSQAAPSAAINTTNTSNSIGRYSTNPADYVGLVDDVRIWKRVLTSSEVANVHAENLVPADGLVMELQFEEGSGTSALDTSGNNLTGTITGATYVDSNKSRQASLRCLSAAATNGGGYAGNTETTVTTVVGGIYRLSAYVRGVTDGVDGRGNIYVGSGTTNKNVNFQITKNWQRHEMIFTADALTAGCYLRDSDLNHTTYWDRVCVERIA